MKQFMFKYFTTNNTYRYIDVIQDIVTRYNTDMGTRVLGVGLESDSSPDLVRL
jgi:hypothetical protein